MLRPGYSLRESYHISAKMAPLAQLLHCVEESVACPMGPRASGDWRTDAEAGLAVGTKEKADASVVHRPSRSPGGPFHKDRFSQCSAPSKSATPQTPFRVIGAAFAQSTQ